jgi:uncharacterized protein YciI
VLFAVTFTDKVAQGELREKNLAAHIDWLEKNRDVIPIGGTLRDEPNQTEGRSVDRGGQIKGAP